MTPHHKDLTQEKFMQDVSRHQTHILHDDGVYRCIEFRQVNGDSCRYFTLTTWPGYLCISGDMGDFVFWRLHDMFDFFTAPSGHRTQELYINPSYWAEKCVAESKFGNGVCGFDPSVLRKIVINEFQEWLAGNPSDIDIEDLEETVLSDLEDEVLVAESEEDANRRAQEFESCGFTLKDFWEHDLTNWNFHFIWCLYAISWGIKKYKETKNGIT